MKDRLDLLVIGSYPPAGTTHDKTIVGGASYTKNTLVNLYKAAQQEGITPKITVFAEKLESHQDNYEDEGIKIKPIWKRNSLTSNYALLLSLWREKTKDVLLTFEFSMFGNLFSLIPLPLFLVVVRLLRKRLHIVLHQVITDASSMSGHLNISETGLKPRLYSFFFSLFYRLLFPLSKQLIVFEAEFKTRLARLGPTHKVVVIPHGVEAFKTSVGTTDARASLGLPQNKKIVLCFGFLAWYKGTDWIVSLFHENQKDLRDIQLVIAGGPNKNHLNKPFYKEYLQNLERIASKAGVTITGFVPEEHLPLYFVASDLALFPYRSLMAASGPLSLACSFGTPFLLSDTLTPLLETDDFRQALEEEQLSEKDITFPLTASALPTLLETISTKSHLLKLQRVALKLARLRSWEKIGRQYKEVLIKYAS